MPKLLAINIGDVFEIKGGVGISKWAYQSPGSLISVLIKNAYIVAGILMFGLLIFGGISIILNAGSGDARKTGQGAKAITAALAGFAVIFCSYWIIQVVQKITGVEILNSIL